MNEETLSRCQERHLLVPQCGVPRYTDSVRDAATEIGTQAPSEGDPAAFPLVEELFGCGTDYHMAVSIFQRSNNSAEEVRDMLSEWKALCADYEFHVITRCLLHNGPDLDAANGTLQELYNLAGPTLWPKIMTIVERWGFNLSLTVLRLGSLRKLGTEVDFVRILNALEGNMYNYQTTREHISRISDTKYCRDIGHGVEVWGACSFDVDAAVKKLGGKPIPFFGKCFIALWCCGMLFMVAGLFGLIDV
ncbi:hypothetical protein FS842_006535 [Serendipita sp. 407]|nr:hypothetical protein FS842_006535 [Serendipita sp. 407]